MNSVEQFIAKQEYLLSAASIKEGKSNDFCEGFHAGAKWLSDYIKENLDCQTSQLRKSEDA